MHGTQVEGLVDGGAVDLRAVQGVERDAVLRHAPPLAPRLLALLGREAFEVVIEAAVVVVAPVELHVASCQPAGACERGAVRFADEQRVHRGQVARLGEITGRIDESRAGIRRRVGPHQQSGTRDRGERHREHELGVVGEAVAFVGLRPGEIEHELAEGMRLEEGRRGGGEAALVVQCYRRRKPAAAGADAARALERGEERVAQEGRASRVQRVPRGRVNVRNAGRETCPHRGQPCIRFPRT